MWLMIRGYLLSFVLPVAIDILSTLAESIGPKVKEILTSFFQEQYDAATLSGDTVWQSIIVSIIVPIFGLVIVLAPEAPGILTPGEIVSLHRNMSMVAAKKVRAKYDAAEPADLPLDPPGSWDGPENPSDLPGA